MTLATAFAPTRRLLALDAKLGILRQEAGAWLRDSADAQARFALHQSQIKEVCQDLDAIRGLIAQELDGLRQLPEPALADIERLERRILAALQIWDSYRAKWALRIEPTLRLTLNLIDDLAWRAYRPAHERALASGQLPPERARLPPLVFTNPRWSPFARSREMGYELDEDSGVLRQVDDFEPYLRCMPVPLIGIPWTLVAHLPDAVFVGHEVGHLVEDDLALDGELRAAIQAVLSDETHRQAWSRHWRSEVFADLWGVLCCGPAYAQTLAELLYGASDAATESQPDAQGRWSAYPTRALRLQVVAQALRCLPDDAEVDGSFARVAAALEARWRESCPGHAMADFDEDVQKVVRAMLTTPLQAFAAAKGKPAEPVLSVLCFTSAMHKAALADVDKALGQRQPGSDDVRVLFAGMALAFLQSPQSFRDLKAQQRFVDRLQQRRTQGVRAGENAPPRPDAAARSEATAARFFGLFGRASSQAK